MAILGLASKIKRTGRVVSKTARAGKKASKAVVKASTLRRYLRYVFPSDKARKFFFAVILKKLRSGAVRTGRRVRKSVIKPFRAGYRARKGQILGGRAKFASKRGFIRRAGEETAEFIYDITSPRKIISTMASPRFLSIISAGTLAYMYDKSLESAVKTSKEAAKSDLKKELKSRIRSRIRRDEMIKRGLGEKRWRDLTSKQRRDINVAVKRKSKAIEKEAEKIVGVLYGDIKPPKKKKRGRPRVKPRPRGRPRKKRPVGRPPKKKKRG